MITFKTEQMIDRSADDVWAYAADILRHPEWMGVTNARLVAGTGQDVGTRAIEQMKLGPRTVDVEFTVAESIPARRLRWRVAGRSPLAGEVTLDLEAHAADRTRAVWSGSIGLKGPWRLLEPLMAGEVKEGEAAELRRLKANLEAGPAMTAPIA
jgi:Polyketide cyclase / dehydrase and lipid transport